MDLTTLKTRLIEAANRYRSMSFAEVAALGEKAVLEEDGIPGTDSFCQIEAVVLDKFSEAGVDVLHVPVAARDETNHLSAELFFYSTGKVRWDGAVYRYREGVPELMS